MLRPYHVFDEIQNCDDSEQQTIDALQEHDELKKTEDEAIMQETEVISKKDTAGSENLVPAKEMKLLKEEMEPEHSDVFVEQETEATLNTNDDRCIKDEHAEHVTEVEKIEDKDQISTESQKKETQIGEEDQTLTESQIVCEVTDSTVSLNETVESPKDLENLETENESQNEKDESVTQTKDLKEERQIDAKITQTELSKPGTIDLPHTKQNVDDTSVKDVECLEEPEVPSNTPVESPKKGKNRSNDLETTREDPVKKQSKVVDVETNEHDKVSPRHSGKNSPLISQEPSRSSSRSSGRVSYDDRILPGYLSRPESPFTDNSELRIDVEIANLLEKVIDKVTSDYDNYEVRSRPHSRLSHDERIVPGVVSRPASPVCDDLKAKD